MGITHKLIFCFLIVYMNCSITKSFDPNNKNYEQITREDEWSKWICHSNCGKGIKSRKKNQCDTNSKYYINNENKEICSHESSQTGDCFSINGCSDKLLLQMKQVSSKYSKIIGKSYIMTQGQKKTKLSCHNQLKTKLDSMFGNVLTNGISVDWFYKGSNLSFIGMKKGGLITRQKYKIDVKNKTELIINKKLRSAQDSGIYICFMQFPTIPTSYLVLDFIALAIDRAKPLIINHGDTRILSCNGGYIIRTLFKNRSIYQVWLKNEHVIQNDSLRNLSVDINKLDLLVIKKADLNDSGTYKCFISDPVIQTRWYTTIIILEVKNQYSVINLVTSFQIIMLFLIVTTYALFKTYKIFYY